MRLNSAMPKQIFSIFLMAGTAGASETLKGFKKDFASIKTKVSAEVETVREKIDDELAEARGEKNGIWKKIKRTLSSSLGTLNAKIQSALKD